MPTMRNHMHPYKERDSSESTPSPRAERAERPAALEKRDSMGSSNKSSSDGDHSDHGNKPIRRKDNSLSSSDVLITMLQGQLKKMEDLYKKSLDDQQEMRYKYSNLVHEMAAMKIISNKLEAENKKLSKQPEIERNVLKERNQLLQESEKWKHKYEDLSIRVLESEQPLSDGKQRELDNITSQFKKIESMLTEQNEKINNLLGAVGGSIPSNSISDEDSLSIKNAHDKSTMYTSQILIDIDSAEDDHEVTDEHEGPGIRIIEATPQKPKPLILEDVTHRKKRPSNLLLPETAYFINPNRSLETPDADEVQTPTSTVPPTDPFTSTPIGDNFLLPDLDVSHISGDISSINQSIIRHEKPSPEKTSTRHQGEIDEVNDLNVSVARPNVSLDVTLDISTQTEADPIHYLALTSKNTNQLNRSVAEIQKKKPRTNLNRRRSTSLLTIPQNYKPESKKKKVFAPQSTSSKHNISNIVDRIVTDLPVTEDPAKKTATETSTSNLAKPSDKPPDASAKENDVTINNLKQTVESQEKEIDKLKQQGTEISSQLNAVTEDNSKLKTKIEELQVSLRQKKDQEKKLLKQVEDANEKFRNLEEVLEKMKTKVSDKDTEIQDLKTSKEETSGEIVEQLKQKNKGLVEELGEKNEYISSQKNKIQELEKKLAEVMNDVKEYNQQSTKDAKQLMCICEDLDGKLQQTKVDLDKQNTQAKDNDQNMRKLIDSNKKLQNQLSISAQQEKKLINELNSSLSKSEVEKEKLTAENDYLTGQLQAERKEFKDNQDKIKKDLDSMLSENKMLKEKLEEVNAELKAIALEENKELERYKGDNADLKDKLKMCNTELKCLKENSKQIANLKAENSELKNKMSLLHKKLIDLTEIEYTVDELRKANNALKQKVRELEGVLSFSTKGLSTCLDTDATCSDSHHKLLPPINEDIIISCGGNTPLKSAKDKKRSPKSGQQGKLIYDSTNNEELTEVSCAELKYDNYGKNPRIIISENEISPNSKSDTKGGCDSCPGQPVSTPKRTPMKTPKFSRVLVNKSKTPVKQNTKIPTKTCVTCPHGRSLKWNELL